MGFGPARSPTKSLYRSATKSIALAVSAEPPPTPISTFYPCTVYRPEPALPQFCDSGTPEGYCPDLTFEPASGTREGTIIYEWFSVGMDSTLNFKNFPVDIVYSDTQEVLFTIPTPPCHAYMWECYRAVGSGWIFYGYDGFCDFFGDEDIICGLHLCRETPINVPSTGTLRLGTVVQNATWEISEINAFEGWIRTGLNWLKGGDVVEIFGQPANNGSYFVDLDSYDDRVFLSGLTQEGPGGIVLFKPGIFRVCGQYSAVSLPPFDLYPAVMQYAGDSLDPEFEETDQIIHIENAAPYNGTHQITAGEISNEVKLPVTLWAGSPPPGGTWINNATVLVGATGSFGNGIQVTGVNGYYDGFYSSDDVFAPGDGFALRNTKFIGSDSGTIESPGIVFYVDGLPPNTFLPGQTVIISGTGLYDGTYTDVIVVRSGTGQGGLTGGDLSVVWWVGDATGTYDVVGQPYADIITSTIRAVTPTSFSAARAHKTGDVIDMVTDVSRVAAIGHAVQAGWLFSPYDSAEYVSDYYDVVGVVAAVSIDIAARFTATDAGPYGSGPDVI